MNALTPDAVSSQEVAIAVVTCEEACWVRLLDKGTGELFAECPVPTDQPLVTVPTLSAFLQDHL